MVLLHSSYGGVGNSRRNHKKSMVAAFEKPGNHLDLG